MYFIEKNIYLLIQVTVVYLLIGYSVKQLYDKFMQSTPLLSTAMNDDEGKYKSSESLKKNKNLIKINIPTRNFIIDHNTFGFFYVALYA